MMNTKMQTAINDQIQKEFYSAYLYLAMSAYCEESNLSGFAKWLKVQYHEEMEHGMKLMEHLLERGGKVTLGALAAPPSEFGTPLVMFTEVLKHEEYITANINELYEVALAEKDYPVQVMLQWFITEQVEEESNATTILEQLKLVGDNKGALIMLDKELGQRQD
ncbi:MAG TPA: ferritin [Candidatus Avacidaminococcus intestinavium]|uniref:Ferritin n=1 Tax=Candidatus Avacidaminococcus intestinavium TaxID=2840684 RepID=A0A9D1SLT7_9FIRM|nr:ferritin [Candidatus Avacidaminococcus intestinavium]